jgi:hypothetical protein
MLMVAAVAVALATLKTAERWAAYRAQARRHESQLRTLERIRRYAEYMDRSIRSLGTESTPSTEDAEIDARVDRWITYHAVLANKYRGAMWRPWALVAPDPPAPR